MKNSWNLIALAVLAVVLACLLLPLPTLVQACALLILGGFLPGALLVHALVGQSDSPPDRLERVLYSAAAAYLTSVIGMLLVSYLPGGAAPLTTLGAFTGLNLVLIAWIWWRGRRVVAGAPAWTLDGDMRWFWIGALVLLGAGAFFRFTGLSYTEFQGDEARAALRAAAILQGYEDVLFLHKKGPTEIVLPTLLYSGLGVLDEQVARLPFALANLVGLFAVFVLGWRLFHPLAGWIAAMFLALDGYFIGFAHIVQYQSVVFLTSVLVVLILYRIYVTPAAAVRYLTLAALLLATGILSHYEGALVALPAAFLLGMAFWRHRAQWRSLAVATVVATVVGGAVLALFYVPFVLNPRFMATYTYLTDRRIGGAAPYNNLADFFVRTTLYSTTYYVLLLVGLTTLAAVRMVRANLSRVGGWVVAALIGVLVVVTLLRPDWATIGDKDWIVLPFTAVAILLIALPRQSVANRALWIWFSVVFILALFLTEKPRTHVYTFFMPWMLIAGNEAAQWWLALRRRTSPRTATVAGVIAASTLMAIFGLYAYRYFLDRSEVLLNYSTLRPAGYWTVYDEPDDKARFGFPLNNGWKAIGELFRQGVIAGPFDSNEKEAWVPAWYTRGSERCRRDAEWFFEIRNLEPWSSKDQRAMVSYLAEGFVKWGKVQVNGQDKLIIYRNTGEKQPDPTQAPDDGLPVYTLEEFAAAFDASTGPLFPLTYPSVDPPIAQTLGANLGNAITLEGYDIDYTKPLRPGDPIRLTLYWRAQRPIEEAYKVFNQSYFGDGQMIAQRDGHPVCESRRTDQWDPGELITDPYLITVKADAPDGLYPLYTGMYLEETFERLPVLDASGAEIGTQVHLTDIRIGEE